MYNLSDIMRNAWIYFKQERYETFSECLKASWEKEKEFVADQNEYYANVEKSEEVKAWNWAEKKLGLNLNVDNRDKLNDVLNVVKSYGFSRSIWACAMEAVKLYKETQDTIAKLDTLCGQNVA